MDRADALAAPRGWTSASLETLPQALSSGPAAIFLCTGSDQPLLDIAMADMLPHGPLRVLDLSVPAGVSGTFRERPDTHVTGIAELKPLAEANAAGRRFALGDCQRIVEEGLVELASRLQQRNVEKALRDLPALIAEVRSTALNEVFADELSSLDGDTRELVDRIVHYLEKKYISLPMKLAKEVVMEQLDQG